MIITRKEFLIGVFGFWTLLAILHHLKPPSGFSLRSSKQRNYLTGRKTYKLENYEREIILKYWELRNWFKTAAKAAKSFGNVTLPPPPEFFDFDQANINLWGHGYFKSHITEKSAIADRVLAQLVWIMQYEIKQYFQKDSESIEKRIYIGAIDSWHVNHLKATYRDTKRVIIKETEADDASFYMKAYNCRLVTKVPQNWVTTSNLDAIVTFASKGASYHQHIIPPRIKIPWFKFTNEPPYVENIGRELPNQAVCSYFRDAPVQFSYGRWVYYDPLIRQNVQHHNFAENRTKFAVIVVSNCNAANNRLGYVEQLQRYISVDIFGKCGPKSCDAQNCWEMIQRKEYKFYLAFENSNCRDYITEKFFNHALKNSIIPVVLGAHPDDYKQQAPEGSYIAVEDFKSPFELAMYLNQVSANADLYNKYFNWHGTGEFVNTEFFQRLCPMLYYMDSHEFPHGNWFQWKQNYTYNAQGDKICLERGQWYWKRKSDSLVQDQKPNFS